ncbi:DUF6455 family protein [Yoonia sp. 208BN28-4]|uniref:DUF6455 family protein n=1 Tax=Yoonia sp. 208BN28-4 TaxID=3126505 RepID=UPI0030A70A78
MTPLGDPTKHFWLTIGMARACRADLADAMHDAKLTQAAFAAMVTACRSCKAPAACEAALAAPTRPTVPPDTCRNRDALLELAAS